MAELPGRHMVCCLTRRDQLYSGVLNRRYYGRIAATLLVAVGVLGVFLLATQITKSCGFQAQDLTPQEAFDLMQENRDSPGFIILDVRTPAEYRHGHIEGALNIDVNLTSFREELEKLGKENAYLVYCRTGNRSRTALCEMEKLGFERTYHLAGGIRGWVGAGLPVSN